VISQTLKPEDGIENEKKSEAEPGEGDRAPKKTVPGTVSSIAFPAAGRRSPESVRGAVSSIGTPAASRDDLAGIIAHIMSLLAPTPPERMVDREGRPYFLWDVEVTLDGFRRLIRDADPDVRAYWTGKLLRQAKPDDVFSFVTRSEIAALWPRLERYLGRQRPFWSWLLERCAALDESRG